MKTRIEVALREKKRVLNIYDIMVMNKFSKDYYSGLTEEEEHEAEKIMTKKDVDLGLLSESFYVGDVDVGKIHYNNRCGKLWKNLNKKEFILLRNYFSSPVKVDDGDVENV